MASIDRQSLAFTISPTSAPSWKIYIPAPSQERIALILPIFGYLFDLRSTISPLVVRKDYEFYAMEACKRRARQLAEVESDVDQISKNLYKEFEAFAQFSLESATALNVDGRSVPVLQAGLSPDTLNEIVGYYVFFYSTYRYAWEIESVRSAMKVFVTSSSASEYQKHFLMSLSAEENSPEKRPAG